MKGGFQKHSLGFGLILAMVANLAFADVYVWDFPIDEAQVKNGPSPDGSTESPGKGRGHLEFDTDSGEILVKITFEGLVGELSKLHVHGPSSPDRSTPRHVLELLGPPAVPERLKATKGTFEARFELVALDQEDFPSLPPQQIVEVLTAGRAYLNVHTTVFGMGEIRGNLGPPRTRDDTPQRAAPKP